jgi:hypothetical protein
MGNGHLKPRDVFGYERWRGSGKVVEEWRLGAVAEAAATTSSIELCGMMMTRE